MDNMFTPTLDWGNELLTSLWWIAKAWVIAAVATMVILVLIGRFTTWGRQFWRITGAYFTGPDSVKVWIWLAVLLLSVITGVRIDVLLSYQGNDMMTSFQVIAAGLGNGDDAVKKLRQSTAFGSPCAFSPSWPPSTSRGSCWICS